MQITTNELRKKWLDFWASKQHKIIKSASVLPDNDPTALFHNSGMHPLVPYLTGLEHESGKRLANIQKCIRTIDIDEVGDATHLTFFEMLGNWSLGDYFKEEQITWIYEFLIDELKIPLKKIAISVFEGDFEAARDEFSAQKWIEQGIPTNRIAYLPKSENWWAKGETGPCGTDSEMFYWTGEEPAPENYQETWEDPRWVEIGNNVFMEFDRQKDGTLTVLPKKNIDLGIGLERLVVALNEKESIYETDAFKDILEKIAEITSKSEISENPTANNSTGISARIVADHIRTSAILLSDGVLPSNTDQGYILRRLIRRAVRHGRKLGIDQAFCGEIAQISIDKLSDSYENLKTNEADILKALADEETQFQKTLVAGEREFLKKINSIDGDKLDGKTAFYIYETYGFPLEMTVELAAEHGKTVDEKEFFAAEAEHKAKSKAGSAQKFAGGLADDSVEVRRLHTATHLMHAALHKVLGDHATQKGSNINKDRLRFDFMHDAKLTPEEVTAVETYVNGAIAANESIVFCEMTVEEATEQGAIGLFGNKYGDAVKVYSMGKFSKEICGGPHAETTGELGRFKIKKQESCGKGVRRIKAVLITE